MRVVVCMDSWCREQIDCIDKGARSVPEQHRSSPSSRAPNSRDQDFHPAGTDQDPQEIRPGDKIRIVLEESRLERSCREVSVSGLCRREGIKPGVFYAWAKGFMEAGKERLTRDTVRDATRQETGHLKREDYDLKRLVADLSLEGHRFKKAAIPAVD